jgi:ubiquinone/menaquinone biosynthesis C-methylase UbiE
MTTTDRLPTQRFSDRVENYIKYRPHYPQEIIPFLEKQIGLSQSSIIADIGSGTGIFTEMLLKEGNIVYAVEPNSPMREAAEAALSSYVDFHSIDATAEATTLESNSISIITCAQAFHWFKLPETHTEFNRILKRDGQVVLIWNERKTDSTPFLKAYEQLLITYGTDYKEVNHVGKHGEVDALFEGGSYQKKSFPNSQTFDIQGLTGRLLSSSYAPSEGPKYEQMMVELIDIFGAHQVDGVVTFEYLTNLYFGKLHP